MLAIPNFGAFIEFNVEILDLYIDFFIFQKTGEDLSIWEGFYSTCIVEKYLKLNYILVDKKVKKNSFHKQERTEQMFEFIVC